MIEIMALPESVPAPAETSAARLHGEACWHCGAVNAALRAAGQVSTVGEDGIRVWPVVACPADLGRELT